MQSPCQKRRASSCQARDIRKESPSGPARLYRKKMTQVLKKWFLLHCNVIVLNDKEDRVNVGA